MRLTISLEPCTIYMHQTKERPRGISHGQQAYLRDPIRLIRCPNCGEDYSVTYKRCPFCDEKAEEERLRSGEHPEEPGEGESHGGRGGRRLAGSHSHRGAPWTPLRIAGTVIPLAIIAAAIWIVVTQIVPLVNRGEMNEPPVSTTW